MTPPLAQHTAVARVRILQAWSESFARHLLALGAAPWEISQALEARACVWAELDRMGATAVALVRAEAVVIPGIILDMLKTQGIALPGTAQRDGASHGTALQGKEEAAAAGAVAGAPEGSSGADTTPGPGSTPGGAPD